MKLLGRAYYDLDANWHAKKQKTLPSRGTIIRYKELAAAGLDGDILEAHGSSFVKKAFPISPDNISLNPG